MTVEKVFERCLVEPAAPPPAGEAPRPGERWVLRCSRLALERAGGLFHFACPLTVEVVGGANVYVRTDTGRRGVLKLRELAEHWRRGARPRLARPAS